MKALCTVTAATIFALIGTKSFAQNVCDGILNHGIFEIKDIDKSAQHLEQTHHTYCSLTEKELSNSGSSGLDVDYIEETLELAFGFSREKNSRSQFRQKVCSADYSYNLQNESVKERLRTASSAITKAWSDCVNRPGLNVSTRHSSDRKTVIVEISLNSGGANFKDTEVKVAPKSALECDLSTEAILKGDPRSFAAPCTIKVKDIEIALTVTDFSGNAAAFIKPKPPLPQECSLPSEPGASFQISNSDSGWTVWGGKTYSPGREDGCKIPQRVSAVFDINADVKRNNQNDFMRCDFDVLYAGDSCKLVAGDNNWLYQIHTQSGQISDSGSKAYECDTAGKWGLLEIKSKVHNATCDIRYRGEFLSIRD